MTSPSASRSDQIGIHLCYFLGHETKLRNTIGIKFLFVTKGHRLERQDRFAGFIHRFNLVLESLRRSRNAKLSTGVNHNW